MRLHIYLFWATIMMVGCGSPHSEQETDIKVPITDAPTQTPSTSLNRIEVEQEPLNPECITSILTRFPKGEMPSFLGYVVPEPDSCYTMATYQELPGLTSSQEFFPGICFSMSPEPLMEPGDFPTTEEFLSRIQMVVDGNLIRHYRSATETGFVDELHDPETDELLWRIPEGAEAQICFAAPLDPGDHTATIIFKRTSGKEEQFTWSFVLK